MFPGVSSFPTTIVWVRYPRENPFDTTKDGDPLEEGRKKRRVQPQVGPEPLGTLTGNRFSPFLGRPFTE